jgi:hypothetical protein
MFITITVKSACCAKDIRIDSEQKIGVGLKVLRESGNMPHGDEPVYYRSKQNEKLVSAYKTYQEESINDGDILTAVDRL